MSNYPAVLLVLFGLAKKDIQDITDRLHSGQITLDEWHNEMRQIITRYAIAAMMLGLGSETLTWQAEQAVLNYTNGQNPFLDKFIAEMESSSEWNNQWDNRAQMYGEAVQPLYWMGLSRFLNLPAYPGDCTSECMTSDRCMWYLDWINRDNLDVDAYWVDLKDKKVCPTCAKRAIDWFPLQVRNGVVPK